MSYSEVSYSELKFTPATDEAAVSQSAEVSPQLKALASALHGGGSFWVHGIAWTVPGVLRQFRTDLEKLVGPVSIVRPASRGALKVSLDSGDNT